MFEGLLLVQRLLGMEAVKPSSVHDAGTFLDRNWKRLSPYMFRGGSMHSPKRTEEIILALASEPLDRARIDFAENCSFDEKSGTASLPIPQLGPVPVANLYYLRASLRGRRHACSFMLCAETNEFVVEVELQDVEATHSTSAKQPRAAKPGRPRSGIAVGDFIAAFNNRITAKLLQEERLSRQLKTTRFGDLEGREVSGGAPYSRR